MSLDAERAAAQRALIEHGKAIVEHEERLAAIESLLQQLPERMAEAFERSIDRKASDPQTWRKVREAWREQAVKSAGEFLVGGFGGLLKKVAGMLLIAVLVWQLAGFSGVSQIASGWARAAFANWLNKGSP
jgi:hypothetical protein